MLGINVYFFFMCFLGRNSSFIVLWMSHAHKLSVKAIVDGRCCVAAVIPPVCNHSLSESRRRRLFILYLSLLLVGKSSRFVRPRSPVLLRCLPYPCPCRGSKSVRRPKTPESLVVLKIMFQSQDGGGFGPSPCSYSHVQTLLSRTNALDRRSHVLRQRTSTHDHIHHSNWA